VCHRMQGADIGHHTPHTGVRTTGQRTILCKWVIDEHISVPSDYRHTSCLSTLYTVIVT